MRTLVIIQIFLLFASCNFQNASDKKDHDTILSGTNQSILIRPTKSCLIEVSKKNSFINKYTDIKIIHDSVFYKNRAFLYDVSYPLLQNRQCSNNVNKLIKTIILNQKSKFNDLGKSYGNEPCSWQIIEIRDLYLSDDTLSVCFGISNQKAGGVHDFYSFQSLNYDLKNNRLITVGDLKNTKRIIELANTIVDKEIDKNYNLEKIRDFSFNKDTLNINIENYELGDYGAGAPRIKILLNELR